ncbi:hypothetical protein [Sinanaerobacter chloroacetimidivorans]|uniref:Uncharacterized protein n=1 Tax=Sinanaerobacter chloroacetimidivorans TaxID=2818044 RepID=A0A8J7VZQ6_9FIRM|nr:hypothetical protein [Sinanaerobacter chloroacetimidivorans]MBR0596595.1 hypothetical protein [Sinanaerobacter chloroacetimidivorans]
MGKIIQMNDHEKEQAFKAKKAEMQKKYKANISNFCHYHNVELSVGWDMLFFNARCFTKGAKASVIPGGGVISVPELVKDYNDLMQYQTVYKG